MKSKKEFLSVLWLFVTLNYLYCDLMGLMDSSLLKQYINGNVEGLEISQNFLFSAALLMEIPIVMVLLSRLLKRKVNCWANIFAGSLKTLAMVATLFVGEATAYYLFFALIEISTTLYITGYAIHWLKHANITSEAVDSISS